MKNTNLYLKRLIKESIKAILKEEVDPVKAVKDAAYEVLQDQTIYQTGGEKPASFAEVKHGGEVKLISDTTFRAGVKLRVEIILEPARNAGYMTVGFFAPMGMRVRPEFEGLNQQKRAGIELNDIEDIKSRLSSLFDVIGVDAKIEKFLKEKP